MRALADLLFEPLPWLVTGGVLWFTGKRKLALVSAGIAVFLFVGKRIPA